MKRWGSLTTSTGHGTTTRPCGARENPGQVREIMEVDLDDPTNRFHDRCNELRDTIHRVLFKDTGDYVI